jgi:hypothetical protein
MVTRIQDLIAGKSEKDQVQIEGISLPVGPLKSFADDGYEYIKCFAGSNQVALWGKSCSACYTSIQLGEMA